MKQKIANFFSLFTSFSTLLCCALPALLVALGAGAVAASMASNFPWLTTLSLHKGWLFLGSGVLITLNFILVYRPLGKVACRVGGGKACEEASKLNKVVLWVSSGIYSVGLFMAYAALPLAEWIEKI